VNNVLTEIWKQILGEGVSGDDNFFDVGGDSAKAAEIIAAARQRGINLSLAELFSNSSLTALCEYLAQRS
jgi:aryl carrier-like protein